MKQALFEAGGGRIGHYDCCCFVSRGIGQFRPCEGSNPYVGSLGEVQEEEEFRLEAVVADDKIREVVKAVVAVHPYETPAFEVVKLEEF